MAGPRAGEAEEEEEVPAMPPMMKSIALSATGDFLLFLGIIFVLLGIASFATDFLKIKGSGEFLVGVFLVFVAMVLLMRSREAIPKMPTPGRKEKEGPSESYR